jgi:hypothetical protein
MLGLTRKTRFFTARTMLALVGGLWLLAATVPCVMAMSHCPQDKAAGCPPTDQSGLTATDNCDTLTAVGCQITGEERLAATSPVMDFSVVPARLHGLPAAVVLRTPHTPDRYATVILSPPLNLQHAVLLI